jgi:hypothetical protein
MKNKTIFRVIIQQGKKKRKRGGRSQQNPIQGFGGEAKKGER